MTITTEQVLDMMPAVADIYDKLDFENLIKESRKKFKAQKNVEIEDITIDAMSEIGKKVFRNAPKIKKEIFEVVAIAQGLTAEQVKEQSFAKTLATFKAIFKDEEIMELFKSAM